jgi:SAM-dependent methyltransferase
MQFQQGDAYALDFADESFDLVVCRHMLQAVPRADDIIRELVRVALPGGRLHLLNEDYGMIHIQPGELNPDDLWRHGVFEYMNRTGTDARIGLSTFELLGELNLSDIRIDYLTIDTIRVDRNVFASIMCSWRDGYAETLSAHSDLDAETVRALFDQIIDTIMDESKYAVWHVPIISGLVN